VQDPLKSLLQGVAGADRVLGRRDALPEVDAEIPLMSLPFLLKNWPPPAPPYLRHPLGALASFGPGAVGLGWQGNPSYKADHLRSLPLNKVQKLFELPQIRWISLQKGLSVEALAPWPTVMDFGSTADLQKPFEDTARAILSLDRVITSDTALAHLAGALGAEVWLLVAHTPDWRWPLQGTQSIWYPRMRLFRQPAPGDWDAATGRFVVRERDAHAWAEVWFPTTGWVAFDPTADVPLAGTQEATPGANARDWREVTGALLLALGVVVLAAGPVLRWVRKQSERLRTKRRRRAVVRTRWDAAAEARLERIGAAAGRPRGAGETVTAYAAAVAVLLEDPRLIEVGQILDREQYQPDGAAPGPVLSESEFIEQVFSSH